MNPNPEEENTQGIVPVKIDSDISKMILLIKWKLFETIFFQ